MTDDRSDCFLRDDLVRLSYVASGVLNVRSCTKQYVLQGFPKRVLFSYVGRD
jgi:hypothetical protein